MLQRLLLGIAGNAGTILVSLALLCLVIYIIVILRRDKKQGKSSCGSSCGCCPMAGKCHGGNGSGEKI